MNTRRGVARDTSVMELTEHHPRAAQPDGCKVELMPHQLTLLHRCRQYENEKIPLSSFRVPPGAHADATDHDDVLETKMGIMGDSVGAGKSYVILGLVTTNTVSMRTGPSLRSYGCNHLVFYTHDRHTRPVRTTLLVIPHNLVGQWTGYIRAFSDDIKYMMLNRKRMLSLLLDDGAVDAYDLIVVTNTMYNDAVARLASKNVRLRRVVFDEADDLKIQTCAPVDCEFCWFVTASYANLLWPRGGYERPHLRTSALYGHDLVSAGRLGISSTGYIKKLFTDLDHGLSKAEAKMLVVRSQQAFIETSMRLPPVQTRTVTCKMSTALRILNGIANNDIIAALNAGDIDTAMDIANPHHRGTEDSIIQALVHGYERQLLRYQDRLHNAQHTMLFSSDAEREAYVNRQRAHVQDVQRRIDTIQERVRGSDTCCICLCEFDNKTTLPCCGNSFCFACLTKWLTHNQPMTPACPMCKAKTNMRDMMVVRDDDATAAASLGAAAPAPDEMSAQNDKLQNLEALFRRRLSERSAREGAPLKMLVFASYENAFDKIAAVLRRTNLRFARLRGNHMVIQHVIKEYRTGHLDVLLVNARQHGCGLNLENTTDVVMFHKFDDELEHQIIGRAQRYGRVDPLRIWYLLHANEMPVPPEQPTQPAPAPAQPTIAA